MGEFLNSLLTNFWVKQDPAGLGIARFLYGFIMVIDLFEERGLPYVVDRWGDLESCYFPLFDALPRFPVEYMIVLYLILLICAVGIMLGFMFRMCCFIFMLVYWYFFFLDKTIWNNHSYLYGLLSILFLFTNANHYFSVDGLMWPSIRNNYVPKWNYGIFRFQLFLLYFYAGIKKIDLDWVSGYSMTGLSRQWIFDPFRVFLTNEQIDFYMIHICGLIFDLSAGFLLYFDSTRIIGLTLAYKFHIMNAVMFNIGMFSYACIAMITIFCYPDWPKKIIRKFPSCMHILLPSVEVPKDNNSCMEQSEEKKKKTKEFSLFSFKRIIIYLGVGSYVIFQIVLPYSHFLTQGYNSWTQGLYGYSWDMMVHSWDTQHVVIKIVDKETKHKQFIRPGAFLASGNARNRIFAHPDMIKQYSACLAHHFTENEEFGISKPEIYFDVWKSLNGRYHQRMIDPHVDILSAHWSVSTKTSWLLPLLVELSSWRSTLDKIKMINTAHNNATDIVFVADFPSLYLENFIAEEIASNVTVLQGKIKVEFEGSNFTVQVNETLNLPSNTTHTIHTISDKPSCYMYVYYNTTWVNLSKEDLIQNDPLLQKNMKRRETWEKLTFFQKVKAFYAKKLSIYKVGLLQMYYAVKMILETEIGSGLGDSSGSENIEL